MSPSTALRHSIRTPLGSPPPRPATTDAPEKRKAPNVGAFGYGRESCGAWIRTKDLRVMSPTSCRCSTPRIQYTAAFTRRRRGQWAFGDADGEGVGVGDGDGAAVIRYRRSWGFAYPFSLASSSSAAP